ncbi:hypothetical protein [Alteromonas stellipolaris]
MSRNTCQNNKAWCLYLCKVSNCFFNN